MTPGDLIDPAPTTVDALVRGACERKCRYDTELAAFMAVGQMRAEGRRGVLRAYRCNKCRAYHLTSRRRVWSGKQWHVGWA